MKGKKGFGGKGKRKKMCKVKGCVIRGDEGKETGMERRGKKGAKRWRKVKEKIK